MRKFDRGGVYKVKPGCLVCGAGPEYFIPRDKVREPIKTTPEQKPITITIKMDAQQSSEDVKRKHAFGGLRYRDWVFSLVFMMAFFAFGEVRAETVVPIEEDARIFYGGGFTPEYLEGVANTSAKMILERGRPCDSISLIMPRSVPVDGFVIQCNGGEFSYTIRLRDGRWTVTVQK